MNDDKAVLFDMDGVLVDSYHAHYQSWLEMAEAEGLSFPEDDFKRTFGCTSRETIAKYWGRDLSDADIAAMDARKEAGFRRIIETEFPAMPGAVELLESLHNDGFRLAVGSSAPPANVDMVLDRMHIRRWFDAVVTGRDVVRGKPDPQVFLTAAERLGVPPIRCAVIEDAPVGIAAANSAGMTSVGFASTGRSREVLAEAAFVVDSLRELSPAVLGQWIERARG
jgi:beta-phosphoglucomutase